MLVSALNYSLNLFKGKCRSVHVFFKIIQKLVLKMKFVDPLYTVRVPYKKDFKPFASRNYVKQFIRVHFKKIT